MKGVAIHSRVDPEGIDSDDQNVFTEDAPITYTTHPYPFESLGSFSSHIQPHFVIFNTGQKLSKPSEPASLPPSELSFPTNRFADSMLCKHLYEHWSGVNIPPEFFGHVSTSSHGRSDQRSSDDLALDLIDEEDKTHPPSGRRVTRSSQRANNDTNHNGGGNTRPPGGRRVTRSSQWTNNDTNQTPDLEQDDLPSGNSTINTNNAASMATSTFSPNPQIYEWKIHEWAAAGAAAAEVRGWEKNVSNDHQIHLYDATMEESF